MRVAELIPGRGQQIRSQKRNATKASLADLIELGIHYLFFVLGRAEALVGDDALRRRQSGALPRATPRLFPRIQFLAQFFPGLHGAFGRSLWESKALAYVFSSLLAAQSSAKKGLRAMCKQGRSEETNDRILPEDFRHAAVAEGMTCEHELSSSGRN